MLQHKNSRPQLAGLAAILSYFHPLPCLTETTYFVGNTPITERAPCPDCSAYDILSEKERCVENPDLKEEPFWRLQECGTGRTCKIQVMTLLWGLQQKSILVMIV